MGGEGLCITNLFDGAEVFNMGRHLGSGKSKGVCTGSKVGRIIYERICGFSYLETRMDLDWRSSP